MMTNVVAKKSSKSFLKNRVVEQNVLGPVGVTSEGGGEGGEGGRGGGGGAPGVQMENTEDVFMAENLPTYAKSYILPRKMHRSENKEKVGALKMIKSIDSN